MKVESLPDPFTKFYLTFIADGDIIEKIPFEYGDSFDLSLLPLVPDKEGHDKDWEEFDPNHMTFNTTIEAIYTPLKTVISSNFVRSEEELPLVLAEGSFRNNVTLKVSPFDIPSGSFPGKYQKILESWDIALEGLEDSHTPTTLRLLLPETKKKVIIWQSTNTGWEKLVAPFALVKEVFPG